MQTTERFSNRVDDYVRSRPHYPAALLQKLEEAGALHAGNTIADIGSGTGISAKWLLDGGYTVIGIEPNTPMREAGDRYLHTYASFKSMAATAQQTSLPNQSIDAIVAAQAFHWFNEEQTRTEFKRILKPHGNIILIWNDRLINDSDFSKSYEDTLRYFGTDYQTVDHKQIAEESFDQLWGKHNWKCVEESNFQDLNFEALLARILSCSYMPQKDNPDYEFMRYVLKKIFVRYQENGTVRLNYTTKAYFGSID
ncbi:MAG: class I SAM-dependent methyltransferase [Bacteroidia bacterium]